MTVMFTWTAAMLVSGEVEAESMAEAERIVEGILNSKPTVRLLENIEIIDGVECPDDEMDGELQTFSLHGITVSP